MVNFEHDGSVCVEAVELLSEMADQLLKPAL